VLLRQKVIDPVGDSRPDADIERDLAVRLGLGEWFTETAEDIVRGQIDGARDPAFAGITFEKLVAAGGGLLLDVPRTPNVQYADLCFTTPTGRAELYLEELADMGEALPVYVEDHEAHRSHPAAAEFPLVLMQAHVRQRAHSTFFNTGWTLEVWPEPTLEMNPDDAAARGLANGDLGEAHNQRGHVVARVKRLLALLGGYSLTPALKGIMAVLSGERAWLRVRPPLVALADEGFAALEREIRAFGIDPNID